MTGYVALLEVVDQFDRIRVVGDAEIRADLLALDVAGEDAQDDVGLVLEVVQQAHLDARVEPGQNARGVHVEQQLAAELQVELVAGGFHAFEDRGGLLGEVLLVVESNSPGGGGHNNYIAGGGDGGR